MTIYSFLCLSGDKRSYELLGDHISNALRFYGNLRNTLFVKNINSRLLTRKVFDELVKYAVFFHDIGKVFYQKANVGKGCLSFVGHEFLSAIVFEKYVVKTVEEGLMNYSTEEFEETLWPTIFSILYHHHAMGYDERLRKTSMLRIEKEFVEKLIEKDIPPLAIQYLSRSEAKTLKNVLKEVLEKIFHHSYDIPAKINSLGIRLWNVLEAKPKLKRLSLATLSTLIILDYLSAYKGRKGPKLKFYNILEQHYRTLTRISKKPF